MNRNSIPEKIHSCNIYTQGERLLGTTGEITLPSLDTMTDTLSGPGVLGEIEAAAPGHFSSAEQELTFRILDKELFSLMNPLDGVDLTVRGATQRRLATGAVEWEQCRVVVRGCLKKLKTGKMKQAAQMEASISVEIIYLLIEVAGTTVLELDKLNSIFVVNGVDVLAKVRGMC